MMQSSRLIESWKGRLKTRNMQPVNKSQNALNLTQSFIKPEVNYHNIIEI